MLDQDTLFLNGHLTMPLKLSSEREEVRFLSEENLVSKYFRTVLEGTYVLYSGIVDNVVIIRTLARDRMICKAALGSHTCSVL